MNKNLLIVGASTYAVVGTTRDIDELAVKYSNIIAAVGNPKVRLSIRNRIAECKYKQEILQNV